MGTGIWLLALGVELLFLIWTFLSGQRHDREKAAVRIAGLLGMGGLLAGGVLQGISRYGFFMGILLVQVLLYGLCLVLKKQRELKKRKMTAALLGNGLLYGICLLPALVFPQYEELPVTGPFSVEIAEYTWEDTDRTEIYSDTGENRTVTIKVWYPEEEGSYPLVVFSHGAFGIIDSNYSTCTELASNGYVVVSIGHPYHAMFVKDVNGKVTMADKEFVQRIYTENGTNDPETEARIFAYSQEWMAVRAGDENFVLDMILAKAAAGEEGPFALVDTEKIGLFGHSMGGASSVEVGRERDDIDAVIDLEGTMFGEYTGCAEGVYSFREEPYPIPLLDVNSGAVDRQAKDLPGGQTYVNFYVGEHAADYHYVVIEGAGHLNFTDLPVVSPVLARMLGVGEIDARTCIEQVNAMVLRFFDYYLKGK